MNIKFVLKLFIMKYIYIGSYFLTIPKWVFKINNYITFGLSNGTLEAFSIPHLVAMGIILMLCIALFACRTAFKNERSKRRFSYILAAFITFQQASIYIWYTISGEWSAEVTLPLQLSDLSLFLSIAVLLTKQQFLSELLYYWGMGGVTQAILTPDIGSYTYPHFVFYQFFVSHGVILLVCIYMIAVEKFRPSPRSVLRTFLIINLYAILILPVNQLTGGNYLFLSRKPIGGSLLDFLGPWPWYLLSLEAVALLLFTLLYLPFAPGNNKARKTGISI